MHLTVKWIKSKQNMVWIKWNTHIIHWNIFPFSENTLGTKSQKSYQRNSQIGPRKKNCLFPSDWVSKKVSPVRPPKKSFSYLFCNIASQFYSFFYLDSMHYLYLKWSISIETSFWYISSIFKTRDNFFQYILIRKFMTIKDDWTKYKHC